MGKTVTTIAAFIVHSIFMMNKTKAIGVRVIDANTKKQLNFCPYHISECICVEQQFNFIEFPSNRFPND
jgi:hypothetical protein